MEYVRHTMSLSERAKMEASALETGQVATEQEKQAAKIDLIAMISDIDLSEYMPEEEEEGMSYEE